MGHKPPRNKNEFHLLRRSAIFSVMLFLLVTVVGGAFFMLTTRRSIRASENESMTLALVHEVARLEAALADKIEAVKNVAELSLISLYLASPDHKIMAASALSAIQESRASLPDGAEFFWVSVSDKILRYDDHSEFPMNPHALWNAWYYETLEAAAPFHVNTRYNADSGRRGITISAPVFSASRAMVGAIGAGSDLAAFIGDFYDNYEGTDDLFFVDKTGMITLSPSARQVSGGIHLDTKLGYIGKDIIDAIRELAPGQTRVYRTHKVEIGISRARAFEWYAVMISPNADNGFKTAVIYLLAALMATLVVLIILFNIFILDLFKPLRDTMRALEIAVKVKDDFLAKMSHEIRTPMNAITGMAELALREDMPPAAQEHVYTIKQAGSNLLSIINDILDLSKIGSGKLNIVPSEYSFGALVNDVVSIIRMRVVDSSVRFVVNVDSKIPSVLIGDEVRVRQILLNILSNAVKYTKEGHISLAINGVMSDEDTVNLVIDVADTGNGIKPEDIKKLFGNFVQVDVEANRGIEGTGLGLVITKNLTNAMGGNITVESVYGGGTTFTVTLPQRIASPTPLAVVDAPKSKSVIVYERRDIYANSIACTVDNLGVNCTCVQSVKELRAKMLENEYAFVFMESALYEDIREILADLEKQPKTALLTSFGNVVAEKNLSVIAMPAHTISVANILNGISDGFSYHTAASTLVRFNAPEARILVVDDIKTNLEVARGLLAPYKVRVDVCLSGTESIKMAGKYDYDLIFMDHMMPDMNGITAARRIRELGSANARVPIVALTANAVSGAREMFLDNGFNGFLSKPLDIPDLNATLEKWIPQKKQVRAERKTERMEAVTPEIVIPGVDVKTGIARMNGDTETYMRTLSVFRDDGYEKILEIKRHFDTGNLPMFTIAVHALKGASGNVGAMRLSESARAMEMAGKREDRAYIRDNIGRMVKDLENLLHGIGDAIMSEKARKSICAPPRKSGGIQAAVLDALINAINDLDPDALNAASKELRRAAEAVEFDTEADAIEFNANIERILKNVLIGEYDDAVTLIKQLRESIS